MPLTKKGAATLREMKKRYGKDKGERIFFAMEKSGKLEGMVKKKPKRRKAGKRK
jgi:thermostable 8-oxoguanine DNA glycosylase